MKINHLYNNKNHNTHTKYKFDLENKKTSKNKIIKTNKSIDRYKLKMHFN